MVAWSAWSWVWGCAFVCVNTFIQRMIIPANVGEGFLQVSTWVKISLKGGEDIGQRRVLQVRVLYQVATLVPCSALGCERPAVCRRLSSTPSPSRLLVAAPGPALCRCSASAAYTSILYRVCYITPPNEHTSEGGRDDRGVPYHAESTLSSAQVLKIQSRAVAALSPLGAT